MTWTVQAASMMFPEFVGSQMGVLNLQQSQSLSPVPSACACFRCSTAPAEAERAHSRHIRCQPRARSGNWDLWIQGSKEARSFSLVAAARRENFKLESPDSDPSNKQGYPEPPLSCQSWYPTDPLKHMHTWLTNHDFVCMSYLILQEFINSWKLLLKPPILSPSVYRHPLILFPILQR